MPYIDRKDREHIDRAMSQFREGIVSDPLTIEELGQIICDVPSNKRKGAFNYFVSRLFSDVFDVRVAGYTELSNAIAVFGDMEAETRRRLMDPYEDKCIEKNGDLEEWK